MLTQREIDSINRLDKVSSLLDEAGWVEVIETALESRRAYFQNLLVQSVLGKNITDLDTNGVISKEMLAGRVEGIDWLFKFLTGVLQRGDKARKALSLENYEIRG